MKTLVREYPNGVSFAPMALRLLRQKVPFTDPQIEDLKALMFKMDDDLWFSREMIADDHTLLTVQRQAKTWLTEKGCFAVERFGVSFYGVLRHVTSPDKLSALLRHLGFTVVAWKNNVVFCCQTQAILDEALAETAKKIDGMLIEAGGTLVLKNLEEEMPHLTIEALEGICAHFLPEVHKIDIGGLPCLRNAEAINLPEDFAEKLTLVVDTLIALDEKVTAGNLEFALNLTYRFHFREEFALQENITFMRVCALNYKGNKTAFQGSINRPLRQTHTPTTPEGRTRCPNTRFQNLGVPIGAELVFSKDRHITCKVLDETNQVEHKGKVWAISALAMHLLGGGVINGFAYFSYAGEILLERRLRLERDGSQGNAKTNLTHPPARVKEEIVGVIGLGGQPLSPVTWHAFKSDGTSPRVAEWARRVENGESAEKIARELGFSASTVKLQLGNRNRYFKVCEINKIVPEGSLNV
jgi:hypothetical protein